MHIAGESLLNDGSAVVFYSIFSSRFFYEMGIPGIGDEIGWGEGFLMFFRLSLGGMCIGLVFGVGAVFVLYHLNRRLSVRMCFVLFADGLQSVLFTFAYSFRRTKISGRR